MEIISHRGYWQSNEEKNTVTSFERSFSLGFGTETDIRDFNGELVISHDIANAECISFKEFISLYKAKIKGTGTLALNVKADGLQLKAKSILDAEGVTDYFFFDMSIPDMLSYLNHELNTFVRYSEYEGFNSLIHRVDGVWLDGFSQDFVEESLINFILSLNKKVCIVSPELHKREHLPMWAKLKSYGVTKTTENIILCTDLPEQAKEYFL